MGVGEASPARYPCGVDPEHCLDLGQGPPLLLLHGSGAGRRFWHPLAERLGDSHRVLAPDLPGYGGRPWTTADAQKGAITRDLEEAEAWLFEVGEPAHVLGHSYGGVLALAAAAKYGDWVRSVTVYEPTALDLAPSLKRSLRRQSVEAGESQDPGAVLALLIDFWRGEGSWAVMEPKEREHLLAHRKRIEAELAAVLATGHETPLGEVEQPVLVLMGQHAHPAMAQIAEILVGALSRSRAAQVPGAGHWGPARHAERVAALVLEHLSDIDDN